MKSSIAAGSKVHTFPTFAALGKVPLTARLATVRGVTPSIAATDRALTRARAVSVI